MSLNPASPSDPMSNERSGNGKDDGKDATVAKTAGFVVFSGIAMSILKALNPFNNPKLPDNNNSNKIKEPTSLSPQEPIIKKPSTCVKENEPKLMPRSVDIVRGDTLWGLSKEYGVSIEAIKEANGMTGDTIYAGKKLIIP